MERCASSVTMMSKVSIGILRVVVDGLLLPEQALDLFGRVLVVFLRQLASLEHAEHALDGADGHPRVVSSLLLVRCWTMYSSRTCSCCRRRTIDALDLLRHPRVLGILGIELAQLVRVSQRGFAGARLDGQERERRQHVAVVGMLLHRVVQHLQRLRGPARVIETHRVDVGEAPAFRRELHGGAQLRQAFGLALLAHEREPQCVVQHRSARIARETLAQRGLGFAVCAAGTIQVGEVHIGRHERRVDRKGLPILGNRP